MDNHGYQVIRRLQMATVGTSFGNEFRSRREESKRFDGDYFAIDFCKHAESMGARAWHVETAEQLERALVEARAETRSCLVHIEIEKHVFGPASDVWWDVAPAEITADATTSGLRDRYEEGKSKQRYYG